jgi:hypothetical protein
MFFLEWEFTEGGWLLGFGDFDSTDDSLELTFA